MTNKQIKTYNAIYNKIKNNEELNDKELRFLSQYYPTVHFNYVNHDKIERFIPTKHERAYRELNKINYVEKQSEEWKEVGSKLKEKRLELGIKQVYMEEYTGYSASTIRKFENGEPVRSAHKIEKAYKLVLESWEASNKLLNFKEALRQEKNRSRSCVCDIG